MTHDVDEAIAISDRILIMRGGRIAASYDVDAQDEASLRASLLQELGVHAGAAALA